MEEKRWAMIRANMDDIEYPEFFVTYEEAFKEMKRQYEVFSKDCCGELNDDNAWCVESNEFTGQDYVTNWKIFYID